MPALIAAPWLGTAIAGIAAGTGGVVGAKIMSGANDRAAQASTGAANYAADLQAQSNREALAYEQQQADRQAARDEVTQHANYDMWAARERRVGSIGQMVGLGPREIPGYVPINPSTAGAAGAPGGAVANVGDASQKFLSAVQQAGLDPVAVQGHGQVIADAVNKIHPELGLTVDPKSDAIVWNGTPIDVTVDSGKGGWSFRPSGPTMQAPSAARTNSVASYLTAPSARRLAPSIAPALAMPSPYHVGSVGSYL